MTRTSYTSARAVGRETSTSPDFARDPRIGWADVGWTDGLTRSRSFIRFTVCPDVPVVLCSIAHWFPSLSEVLLFVRDARIAASLGRAPNNQSGSSLGSYPIDRVPALVENLAAGLREESRRISLDCPRGDRPEELLRPTERMPCSATLSTEMSTSESSTVPIALVARLRHDK